MFRQSVKHTTTGCAIQDHEFEDKFDAIPLCRPADWPRGCQFPFSPVPVAFVIGLYRVCQGAKVDEVPKTMELDGAT
jgi:hypothetical protein